MSRAVGFFNGLIGKSRPLTEFVKEIRNSVRNKQATRYLFRV